MQDWAARRLSRSVNSSTQGERYLGGPASQGQGPPGGEGEKGSQWVHGTRDRPAFAVSAAGGQCQLLSREM